MCMSPKAAGIGTTAGAVVPTRRHSIPPLPSCYPPLPYVHAHAHTLCPPYFYVRFMHTFPAVCRSPVSCSVPLIRSCLTLVRIWTISRSFRPRFTVPARCPCVPTTANHCTSTNASKGSLSLSSQLSLLISLAYIRVWNCTLHAAFVSSLARARARHLLLNYVTQCRRTFCRESRVARVKFCPAELEVLKLQGFDIRSLSEWKFAKNQY
ncbi:hypothetical protein LXA43DRAFT_89714 [Ganoderma leucocontextum]|nr:hypothetical protein LXA43DRAFT_89714 [Ganoderma leucocontextum]